MGWIMEMLLALAPGLLVGAGLGFLGGMFGIGGGIIAIPLLGLAYGMDQALAQGTALVMMAPNLVVGAWRYHQRDPLPLGPGLAIGSLAMLSTWASAQWATGLDSASLRMIFSIFLLLLALRMLLSGKPRQAEAPPARIPERWAPLVGLVGGCSMGLLGVGGGLIATPLLTSLFGLRQTAAQRLALALVTPSALVALFTYARAGHVDWQMGLPLALSGILTVSAGVRVAHRLPERSMRRAFSWMLLGSALWLLGAPLLKQLGA